MAALVRVPPFDVEPAAVDAAAPRSARGGPEGPASPSPETRALVAAIGGVWRWVGRVAAVADRPDSSDIDASGRSELRLSRDGRWLIGQFALVRGTGTPTAHEVRIAAIFGWDESARSYRAAMADSAQHLALWEGELAGDVLQLVTARAEPSLRRMTFHVLGPRALRWRTEVAYGRGLWRAVEEYLGERHAAVEPVEEPFGGTP